MRFKKIYIEITNVCNLHCTFCPDTKRNVRLMSVEEFELVLQKISSFTNYIYLHVKGEPTLHPSLEIFLELAEKYQMQVNMTTNGTMIEKIATILSKSKSIRQINFSLHSFDGNALAFRENTRTKEEYLKDIFQFIRENPHLFISLRLWNLNHGNKNPINSEILKLIEKEFGLNKRIEEIQMSNRGFELREKVYLNQDKEFAWPSLEIEEIGDEGFCYGLRNQVAILVDGTVVPCCLDGEGVIRLGNIFEDSFKDIVESKRAQNIIKGFSNGKVVEELCKKCGYRERF